MKTITIEDAAKIFSSLSEQARMYSSEGDLIRILELALELKK